MTDKQSDTLLYGALLVILAYLFYKHYYKPVVTATVGGAPVTPTQSTPAPLGTDTFDYSVCGIAMDVARKGYQIRVCTDPVTGLLYPVEDYPNFDSAHIYYLQEQSQIDENLKLNTPTSGPVYGPVQFGPDQNLGTGLF